MRKYLCTYSGMPDAFGESRWMPAVEDATPFPTQEAAMVRKRVTQDATGVEQYLNGNWFVFKDA